MSNSAESKIAAAIAGKDGNALRALAHSAEKSRNLSLAVSIWRSIVGLQPMAENAVKLAQLLEDTGKDDEAMGIDKSILAVVPGHFPLWMKVGKIADRRGQQVEAADAYRRVLTLKPANVDAAISLSGLIWETNPDEAFAVLQNSADQNSANPSQKVIALEVLIRLREWRARMDRRLPVHHALNLAEVPFAFDREHIADLDAATQAWIAAEPKLGVAYLHRAQSELALLKYSSANQAMIDYARLNSTKANANMRFGEFTVCDGYNLPEVKIVRNGTHTKENVAFLSCDNAYLEVVGVPLLRSIQDKSPGMQIHLHVMGGQIADILHIVDSLPRLDIKVTYEDPSAFLSAKPGDYYGAVRFIRFAETLERTEKNLLMMDVDGLMANDPSRIFDLDGEVAFRVRAGRVEPWHQFSACLVMGRNCTSARRYFRQVADIIGTSLQTLWWGIDQYAMFNAYLILQSRGEMPKVSLLGPDHADIEAYRDTSVMWFTAGSRKLRLVQGFVSPENNPHRRYEQAFEHYRSTSVIGAN